MGFDRHAAVCLGGAITAATLGSCIDLYTKLCAAVVGTLTVVYMYRRTAKEKQKLKNCENCKNEK
jgi:hypothetical protein